MQTKMQKCWVFSPANINFIYGSAKKGDEKKKDEDEQSLAELSSAHCHSQANFRLVQTMHFKEIKLF